MSQDDSQLQQAKDVEFYAAALNAWQTTKFELDKSLLTLSAAGIGLVITLISTVGVRSVESLILSLLTMISFVITLVCVLTIFHRNGKYLMSCIASTGPISDPFLATLDRIAVVSFMGGVILASVIGISTATNAFIDKAAKMTENSKTSTLTLSQESMNMFAQLRSVEQAKAAPVAKAAEVPSATVTQTTQADSTQQTPKK